MDFEIEYEHWEDYYKNEYSEIYNREYKFCSSIIKKYDGDPNKIVLSMLNHDNEDTSTSINNDHDTGKFLFSVGLLFDASCHLLGVFLRNNGSFHINTDLSIKLAFRVDFLQDGEEWIELYNLIRSGQNLNSYYIINFIIEHFYIFDNLNKQFKKELSSGTKLSKKCKPMPKLKREVLTFSRIDDLNNSYERFKIFYENFDQNKHKEQFIKSFFKCLEDFYFLYCKFLKFVLKQKRIATVFHKDTIKIAQEKNIINDGDLWLLYIEYMNVFFSNLTNKDSYNIMCYIVEIFKFLVESTYLSIINEYKDFLDRIRPVYEECQKKEVQLENNKPIYDYKEWSISELSYNRIMDFFRSDKELKSVWLHGSRVIGTALPGSDLDLIVDYPNASYEQFKNALSNLKIPYVIDCCNINCEKDIFFIKKAQHTGTKKIYCSDDFS